MAAGIFGYMGYDTVRLIEHLPGDEARPARPSRQHPGASDADRDLRRVKDEMTVVTPVQPRAGRERQGGLCARGRPAQSRGRAARSAAAACERAGFRGGASGTQIDHRAGRLYGQGQARQGVHRRRRYLPGGVEPALRGALHAALFRALSGAAAGQSLAVPLLPQFRRLRRGRVEPRDPGEGARRQGHHQADRRNAPARRDAAKRTRRSPRNCSPTPRSAPST